MMNVGFSALTGILVLIMAVAIPVVAVWLVVKVLNGLGWVLGGLGAGVKAVFVRTGLFIRSTIVDSLQLVGGVLTASIVAPLSLANVVFGRWSAARHYGKALEEEFIRAGLCGYRLALGNTIRLFGLEAMTEGIERRLPELIGGAPGPEPSKKRRASFAGYQVQGTLPAGGSGARLYLAKPDEDRVGAFQRAGHPDPGQVVIKSFALEEGSTLPQIVRESRALECASKLGLVLEHNLSGDSFFYVMPYVPGESLDAVTRRLHEQSGSKGLGDAELAQIAAYGIDLLGALDRFHAGGLWHKDIKPSNVIVSGHQAHLVDLGLVTPLASALTLTTHGTEYYRDPEMVRLAMQGVKVHEVDGVKFDIYSVGAVLFSLIENDFPAQGNLSRITRRCPDALKMIIRRSMADMGTRYSSARAMLEDLRVVLRAEDPFRVAVASLPSMGGRKPRSEKKMPPLPAYPASLQNLGIEQEAPAAEEAPAAPSSWAQRPAARKASRAGRPPGHRVGRSFLMAGVMAFLMLLGVGGLGFAFLTARSHHHVSSAPRPVAIAQSTAPQPVTTRRFSIKNGRLQVETENHRPQGVSQSSAQRKTQKVRPSGPWQRHLNALSGLDQGDHILIVPDPRQTIDQDELNKLEYDLRRLGVVPMGLGRLDSKTLHQSAAVRMAVSLLDPHDGETHKQLQSFLADQNDLQGVVWVTGESSDRKPFVYVPQDETACEPTMQ